MPQGPAFCDACERRCQIEPGRLGHCGVRRNDQGQVRLLTYGKLSACNLKLD